MSVQAEDRALDLVTKFNDIHALAMAGKLEEASEKYDRLWDELVRLSEAQLASFRLRIFAVVGAAPDRIPAP